MYLSRKYRQTLLTGAALGLAAALAPAFAQVNAIKTDLVPASIPAPAATPLRHLPDIETKSGLIVRILKKQALAPKLSKKEQEEMAHEMREERRELLERMRKAAQARKSGQVGKVEDAEEEEEEGPASTQAEAARLYRLMLRLAPGQDSLDMDAITRAMEYRATMKPAPGGSVNTPKTNGNTISGPQLHTNAIVVPQPGPTPTPITNAQWQFFGPKSILGTGSGACTGRVNAIANDPRNPGTAYCGGAKGGLWKTTNGGATWTPLTDHYNTLGISSITIDPTNSNIVYVGTGDSDGGDTGAYYMLKTTDGGVTWNTIGRGTGLPNVAIHKILVDPDNSSVLYAALPQAGLYKSTNAGASWTRINIRFQDYDDSGNIRPGIMLSDIGMVENVVITSDPGRRELVVASDGYNDNVNKGGVYSSFDGGTTWRINLGVSKKPLKTIGRTDVAASLSTFSNILFFGFPGRYDPDTLYVIDGGAKQIYKRVYGVIDTTTNTYGDLWSQLSAPGSANWGQQTYDLYIATGGINNVFVGLVGFHFSIDGGATWVDGQPGHSDQHAISITPSSQYLLGNDGGAWVGSITSQGTTTTSTVRSLNPALFLTQFYFADYNPSNISGFLGGSQDNSSPHTSDAVLWPTVPTGDGGGSVINHDTPGNQYTSSYNSRVLNPTGPALFPVYRTDDTWNTVQDITVNVLDNNLPFLATIKQNLADPRLIYLGTNYLWQYNSTTNTWTQLPQLFTNQVGNFVKAIATSPRNKNVIYTGTTDGLVYYSNDGGQTFVNITANLPGGPVTSLFVSPSTPTKVYATVNGGSSHVYRCDNAASPNWVSISGSGGNALPGISTLSLAIVPSTNEQSIYVGTDIGVFFSADGGTTWTDATAPLGLPNAEIDDLTVVPSTGYLMASTYGRGTWRLPLNISRATVTFSPTLQGFKGNKTTLRYTVTSPAGTYSGNLSSAGTFQIPVPTDNTYNFYITITGFLNKRISGQYITGNTTIVGTFYNGDVNGDNKIDQADYNTVLNRLRPPGQRVNGSPDVDGDGVMTSNDLSIVQSNLGKFGD